MCHFLGGTLKQQATSNKQQATRRKMNRLREFFGSYTELIKENADIVSALESTLESALYLLPSQVSGGGETTSEALYSAVSLLSLFHDLIFIRDLRKKLSSLQMLRRAVSSRTQTQKRPSFASEPNPLNRQLQVCPLLSSSCLEPSLTSYLCADDAAQMVGRGRRNAARCRECL